MNYSQLPEKRKTLDEDWVRLTNILQDNKYFEWSSNRKKVAFITSDSQSQMCNPFHRVYRFSMYSYSDLIIFFNTILALSDKYEPAERLFSFVGDVSQEDKKSYEEDILAFGNTYGLSKSLVSVCDESLPNITTITEQRCDELLLCQGSLMESFFENMSVNKLTYQQIAVFCESYVPFLAEDQNVRKNLDSIKDFHLLHKAASDKRNMKWRLSDSTLSSFVKQCKDEVDGFFDAIDFFSRYSTFGEFGTYILSRSYRESKSLFRFKHEYFAQALNDYIIIDLLKAIENKYWCKLTQSNLLNGTEKSLICFPLQIRISQTNGREYLVFYAPHNHSYSSIRVDLITNMEYIKNIKMNGDEISLEIPRIKEEICNAKKGISSSWGVSTTSKQVNNAVSPVPLKKVELVIKYDPRTEYYIFNRLQHEKRHGTVKVNDNIITFTIYVSDPTEMHPWIRSLYTRIIDYSGLDTDIFNLAVDADSYKRVDDIFDELNSDTSFNVKWFIPEGTTYSKINKYDRDAIFNKFFGVYFMLFGDSLASIYEFNDNGKDYLSDKDFHECIESSFKKRSTELGFNSQETLMNPDSSFNIYSALEDSHFVRRGFWDCGKWVDKNPKGHTNHFFYKKYRSVSESKTRLFYDVVPLSAWELRWLCTILQDKKMNLFLSSDTIADLRALIPSDIKPINMSDIYVFDRYNSGQYKINSDIFKTVISSLHKCATLQIRYKSVKGNEINGYYCPIHIEYSKRDDRFRLYVMRETTKRIMIMNFDRIISIKQVGTFFSMDECRQTLNDFFEKTSKEITIEFKDTRNIPDRILNEFSPWRKRCELIDSISKTYRLTIYYYKSDELDILIRLMSYGPYIRFIDKEHTIYKGIMERIDKQIQLFKSREKDR